MIRIILLILYCGTYAHANSKDQWPSRTSKEKVIIKSKLKSKPSVTSKLTVYFSTEEIKNSFEGLKNAKQEDRRDIFYLKRRPASSYKPSRLKSKAAALESLGHDYLEKLQNIKECKGVLRVFKCRTSENACTYEMNNSDCEFASNCKTGFAPKPLPESIGKSKAILCVRTS